MPGKGYTYSNANRGTYRGIPILLFLNGVISKESENIFIRHVLPNRPGNTLIRYIFYFRILLFPTVRECISQTRVSKIPENRLAGHIAPKYPTMYELDELACSVLLIYINTYI